MNVGDNVSVKYPFNTTFDGVYTILAIVDDTYFLEGIEGGFSDVYLEGA